MTGQAHHAVLATLTIGLAATAASAQLHDGDIFPEIIDGKFTPQADLFTGDFAYPGGPFGLHGVTDDPGYNANYDSVYNGDVLYYEVVSNLYFWSPVTSDFEITSRTVTIQSPLDGTIIGQTGVTNPSDPIDMIHAGTLHAHLDMILSDVSGGSVVNDAIGLYGFQLTLYSLESLGGADTGVEASDPFWLVLNYGVDDDMQIAKALRDFRAIPTPATSGMLLILVGTMARRRR